MSQRETSFYLEEGAEEMVSRSRHDHVPQRTQSQLLSDDIVDTTTTAEDCAKRSETDVIVMESKELEQAGLCRTIIDTLRLSYSYTAADVRRRPRNTIIGVVAVFLLVFFSGLVLVGIWKAPYVLLRLAELSAGEMDVVLYGGGSSPFINYTEVGPKVLQSPDVHGVSPRWLMRTTLQSEEALLDAKRRNVSASEIPFTTANVLVIDSAHEKSAGIGRSWKYPQIGYGQAQIYYSALDYIRVKGGIGERAVLSMDVRRSLEAAGVPSGAISLVVKRPVLVTDPLSLYLDAFFRLNNIQGDEVDLLDIIDVQFPVSVVNSIEDIDGKYSSALGNVVLLDYKPLLRSLISESGLSGPQGIRPKDGYYFPTLGDLFNVSTDAISNTNLADTAMIMIAIFNDRYDTYYSGTATRNRKITRKSNSLMIAAGLNFDGTIEFPIATALEQFDTFKVLLVSAFITIVVCIVILGAILMFTLLDINAEERQFELAMIRAQGMRKTQIAVVLAFQTIAFTLPGTILGVCFLLAGNAVIEAVLSGFTQAPARTANMPPVAMVVSILLGLVLPLVATWGPIRRALGGSLRDALDVYRQAQNETTVIMVKLEEMGLQTWQVLLGIFLVVAGFMVYYLMPLSFIFQDMMLFFVLLDIILICMVVGLCMMLYVAEPYVELGVLYLLLWGPDTRLQTLIRKNLRSHRSRNSKAYMMVLMSVACLISGGVMFTMLSTISGQLAEMATGAQVTVTSSSFNTPLNESLIDSFLKGQGAAYATGWAYSSFFLSNYPQIRSRSTITNFVGSGRTIGVTAISETFQDAVYSEYMMIDSVNKRYSYQKNRGKQDVVRSMYRDAPRHNDVVDDFTLVTGLPYDFPTPNTTAKQSYVIPTLVSSNLQYQIGATMDTGMQLSYRYTVEPSESVQTQFFVEPRALMDRVSGFFAISSLPLLFSTGSLLIPESYFKQLLNPVNMDFDPKDDVAIASNAVLEVRQRTLYIRLRSNVTKRGREAFVNALQTHTDDLYHSIVDTVALIEELKSIQNLIMYFFYFTAFICIILCAFMMWVTFISNVQMNAWTFGVLRSIGFRFAQLVRASIYESLSIIISAFVLGLMIGMLIGATLTLQLTSFMVLPFRFDVPYILILVILAMALLAAIVGPVLPFLSLRKKSISSVLKGI